MSFIFIWAFLDKLFGLGFSTTSDNSWINGGSPTTGFLMNATYGPFVNFYKSLAGIVLIDWLFMLGLLFIGLTLLFNKYVKYGAIAGILMMLFMWTSMLPPENNPVVDDHIVYSIVLAILAVKSTRNESSY